ncbi:MAG TPA: hypothetical protein VK639_18440 [Terriglobales bacterium]|nr:hypothetical protein [Terriglobales bacterium]
MDQEFDILTVKILADEASAEEQARLEQLVAQNPALKQDFADLKAAWDSVREIGPVARAMDAPPDSIPSARLSGLKAAVKKKFGSTSGEDSMAQSEALGRQAQTATRRIEPVRGDNARFGHEASSAYALVKKWFTRTIGLSPMGVGVALLILAALAARVLLINLRTIAPIASGEAEVIAYLVGSEVEPDVRRAGKPIDTRAGASLRASDEVRLAAGAKTRLITPNGFLELSGPMVSRAGNLVTNQTDKTQPSNSRGGLTKEADAMRVALFRPANQLLASALLVTTRGGQSIPLYSPLGSTANLTPLILWKSEPGKTYIIAITDEFDQNAKPLRLSGVVPPVDFAEVEAWKGRTLPKDGLYRITLSETGKPLSACEYTFRTLKETDGPNASAEKLLHAYRILATEPSRFGDALAELWTLPPASAGSELALRLKLFAFGQQGYREDFDALAERVRTLNAVP